jgi:cell division protein FtsI (penicillin-binding protein 3)
VTEKEKIVLRSYLVFGAFIVGLVAVLVKTYIIQFSGASSKVVSKAGSFSNEIPTRTVEKFSRMGNILDCNQTTLLTTVSFFDIYMDPCALKDQKIFDKNINKLGEKLSEMFPDIKGRDWSNYIRNRRKDTLRYVLIKRRVTNEQRNRLRKFPIFELGKNKGGLIEVEITNRKRPFGDLMKRTLGYYEKDERTNEEFRVGIEGAYYEYLFGQPGIEIEQKLATGWKKTGKVLRTGIDGADVISSVDKEIQEVAQNELHNQLKSQKANSGCVIVMDVKTGFVKAIANLTLNQEDGNYYETFNQAIGVKEVPGSTFKLASLMAGLEDEKFEITDTVQCASSYNYYGKTLNEAKRHNYGRITIQQAFEKSSNVISKIIFKAYRDEPQEFVKHLDDFGLTEPLGIDLKGEPVPTILRPGTKNWSAISLPWMAVGYEFQQTPLQTLAFYNAVANDGKLVRPQFVKEIRRGVEVVKTFQPVVLRQKICSKKTLEILQGCLKGVMKNGTGKKLTSSYFEIAGKTGTAQVLNDKYKSNVKGQRIFMASFVGYFPANKPLYSCIVSVEALGENVYGSVMSGTVFSAIANKVYASRLKYHAAINEYKKKKKEIPVTKDGNAYDLKKSLKYLKVPAFQQSGDEWVKTSVKTGRVEMSDRTNTKNVVPNVVGLVAKDAVYLIENSGMNVKLNGFGKVVKQSQTPGKPIYRGGLIELTLKE